ncbi:hypothetical protein ACFL6N_02875 [Thermodesulfobacteriota bacterium]
MKCLDFNDISVFVTNRKEVEAHIKTCTVCRRKWDEHAFQRKLVDEPFDPEAEAENFGNEVPLEYSRTPDSFWQKVQEALPATKKTSLAQKLEEMLHQLIPDLKNLPHGGKITACVLGYFENEENSSILEQDLADCGCDPEQAKKIMDAVQSLSTDEGR